MKPAPKPTGVVLYGEEFSERDAVKELADILGFSLLSAELRETAIDKFRVGLRGGEWLIYAPNSRLVSVIDYSSASIRRRIQPNNLFAEYVVRAVLGRKKPAGLNVWDLTAGLGVDSFLLAAAGCRVSLFERIPMLAILLQHAIQAGSITDDKFVRQAALNLQLFPGNSIGYLKQLLELRVPVSEQKEVKPAEKSAVQLGEQSKSQTQLIAVQEPAPKIEDVAMLQQRFPPDIIYLDPMFHADMDTLNAQKQKAAVKKPAALLQLLSSSSNDVENNRQLLLLALQVATQKVIVKRAGKSEYLGSIKPSSSIQGKAVRFDIYPLA